MIKICQDCKLPLEKNYGNKFCHVCLSARTFLYNGDYITPIQDLIEHHKKCSGC